MDQRWVQPKKSGCQKGGGVNTSLDRGVVKDMGVAATCNGIGRGGTRDGSQQRIVFGMQAALIFGTGGSL